MSARCHRLLHQKSVLDFPKHLLTFSIKFRQITEAGTVLCDLTSFFARADTVFGAKIQRQFNIFRQIRLLLLGFFQNRNLSLRDRPLLSELFSLSLSVS